MANPTLLDSDLNPLTRADVRVVSDRTGRISVALTASGRMVALMFAHDTDGAGKLDAYVYDEEGEHHIEV